MQNESRTGQLGRRTPEEMHTSVMCMDDVDVRVAQKSDQSGHRHKRGSHILHPVPAERIPAELRRPLAGYAPIRQIGPQFPLSVNRNDRFKTGRIKSVDQFKRR